jgi:hypothetical protein
MNYGSYYLNQSYSLPGVYKYFIWAIDVNGNSIVSSNYSFSIVRWYTQLTVSSSFGQHDIVLFGEEDNASDGQDSYDVPKPGPPPSPYVYCWFETNLSAPYNILFRDFRKYPDTYKTWDLHVAFENTSSDNITISWNPNRLNNSEYLYVLLKDIDLSTYTNMLSISNYTFFALAGSTHHFQIICSILPIEFQYNISLSEKWNLISLPVNKSINKDNITVNYLGVNYTWQQAVDNGTILDFVYEWNATSQNYGGIDFFEPGHGYWMYAYHDCNLWISTNNSNNDNYITNLLEKWNIIGLPFNEPVAKENISVYFNGSYYSWQQAVDNGTILDFIYGWNTTGQVYEGKEILEPGKGYWMYAYYNCSIVKTSN